MVQVLRVLQVPVVTEAMEEEAELLLLEEEQVAMVTALEMDKEGAVVVEVIHLSVEAVLS